MSRIEDELQAALAESADSVAVPVDAWQRQLARRRTRQPWTVVGAAAAAVLLVVAGVTIWRGPSVTPADRRGETRFTLSPTSSLSREQLGAAATSMRERLASAGVQARVTVSEGGLVVMAPAGARAVVEATAAQLGVLEFRPVIRVDAPDATSTPALTGDVRSAYEATDCTDPAQRFFPTGSPAGTGRLVACDREGTAKYVLEAPEPGLTVQSANAGTDGRATPNWLVTVTFTPAGARAFERVTGEHLHQQLAIVVDGVVFTAPTIESSIPDGRAQISGGNLDEAMAKQLAAVLSNPLPARFTVQTPEPRSDGAPRGLIALREGIAEVSRSKDGSNQFGGPLATAVAAYGDGERVLFARTSREDECRASVTGYYDHEFADGSGGSGGLPDFETRGAVTALAVSPDLKYVGYAQSVSRQSDGTCHDGELVLRDRIKQTERRFTTSAGDVSVTNLSFNTDGKLAYQVQVCCGDRATTFHVFDPSSGRDFVTDAREVRDPGGCDFLAPTFRPGTRTVAVAKSCGENATVVLVDPATGRTVSTLVALPGVPDSLDFDATGQHLLAAVNGEVLRWDGSGSFRSFAPDQIDGSEAQW